MDNERLVIRIGNRSLIFASLSGEGALNASDIRLMHYSLNSGISMAANLREAMRQTDMGRDGCKRCYLMVDTPRLLVPIEMFCEAEKEELYSHSFPKMRNDYVEQNVVADINAVVLFSLNKDIKTVVADRIPDTRVVCAMAPVWKHLYQRSFTGSRNKLFAYFHEGIMDLASFGHNKARFANSFKIAGSNDAAYFILYAWKQLQMDQHQDEIHLVGDFDDKDSVVETLKRYVRRAYVINPVSDFNRSPIAQIEGMPYDVMVYLIKGR